MNRITVWAACLVMALHSFAFAQEAAPAEPAPAHALTPFINESTVVAARMDIAKMDGKAFIENVQAIAKEGLGEEMDDRDLEVLAQILGMIVEWRDKYIAAGGREIYVLWHVSPRDEPLVIVPLHEGADEAALLQLIVEFDGPPHAVVMHNCIVGSGRGLLDDMRQFVPAARPDLAAFLASKQEADIEVFVSLSEGVRMLVNAMAGQVEEPQLQNAIVSVARDVKSAKFTANAWPKFEVRGTVEANNADAAAALNKAVNTGLDFLIAQIRNGGFDEEVIPMLQRLRPKQQDDKLVASMDHEGLIDLVKQMVKAEQEAQRRRNVRFRGQQLTMGVVRYANDHQSAMPTRIEDLKIYAGEEALEDFALVPYHGKKINQIDDPASAIIIIEKLKPNAEYISVGYADGHTETLPVDEARKHIEENTGRTLEGWSAPPSVGA